MERRGDVQNKIKEKERVSLKARGMSEPAFASSLPRFRARDVRFLVYFIIVLFLSFCWVSRGMLAHARRVKERKF